MYGHWSLYSYSYCFFNYYLWTKNLCFLKCHYTIWTSNDGVFWLAFYYRDMK